MDWPTDRYAAGCPDATALCRLAVGQAAFDEEDDLLAHIDICAKCESRLQHLESQPQENPFRKAVRPHQPKISDGPVIAELVSRIRKIGKDSVTDGDATAATTGAALSRPSVVDRLVGDYELLDEIARGGMGVVYKAWQTSANRLVALKMILSGPHAEEREVLRFYGEAVAAARLEHPNIVPIYHVDEHRGQPYFVMQYITGETLQAHMRRESFAYRQIAEIMCKIAAAIEYSHQQEIIHRDLKPANVMMDSFGNPHITDFGLSWDISGDHELTVTGQVMGTPNYMSPEQATGNIRSVGRGSDIYSLGAILYELLTGRPPFQASQAADILRQVIEDEPIRPRALVKDVPHDLETICLKCLEKSSERRFESAGFLQVELQRWIDGKPIQTHSVGRIQRSMRWVKRHPAPTALLVVGLIALFALGGLAAALVSEQSVRIVNARLETSNARLEQSLSEAELARREAVAANARAEQADYFRRIALANQNWHTGTVARMAIELAGTSPSARDWEWNYLQRLREQDEMTFRGHALAVGAMAILKQGEQVISAGEEGGVNELLIWELASGRVIRKFSGGERKAISLSPNEEMVGIGNLLGKDAVVIISLKTGETVTELPGRRVAFSPDGKWVATAPADDAGRVRLFHADSFDEHWSGATSTGIEAIAFDPSSISFATRDIYGEVIIWDISNGAGRSLVESNQSGRVRSCVAYSPDGHALAVTDGDSVLVLDAKSGQVLKTHVHTHSVSQIDFHTSGTKLAFAGASENAYVWDLETGTINTFRGHTSFIGGLAFHPGGDKLLTASIDRTIKVWDLNRPSRDAITLQHDGCAYDIAWSPDTAQLLVGHGGTYRGEVSVWAVAKGRQAHFKRIRQLQEHASTTTSVAYYPKGENSFMSGSYDHTIKGWNAADDQPQVVMKSSTVISDATISPNGRLVASAGVFIAQLWDALSGTQLRQTKAAHATCVAFSPDSTIVAIGGGEYGSRGTVTLWEVETGKITGVLETDERVVGLGFSRDGRWLAAGQLNPKATIWDMTTGLQIAELIGHQLIVEDVAFSPDGNRIATASGDRTVRVWDRETSLEVLTLEGHSAGVRSVEFSGDGNFLGSAGDDGVVRIWDARPSDTPAD